MAIYRAQAPKLALGNQVMTRKMKNSSMASPYIKEDFRGVSSMEKALTPGAKIFLSILEILKMGNWMERDDLNWERQSTEGNGRRECS
jgi:hypothetical protein